MLTNDQLNEIKARMDEEHRRDREALDRLVRFLPQNGTVAKRSSAETDEALDDAPTSILEGIETIMRKHSDRTWTVTKLRAELSRNGHELKAKNPNATIGVSLKKLCDRGMVNVIRRGSGREPNVYRYRVADLRESVAEDPEGDS